MDTQAGPALLAVFALWATPCQGWKDWKLPRKRRRMLIKLGVPPEEVKRASRSRKGYWRMSQNRLVRLALFRAAGDKTGRPRSAANRTTTHIWRIKESPP